MTAINLKILAKPQLHFHKLAIRIYHECEGGIEKSVPRITDWHHEACRVMTIDDHKGWIFLSHPHTNNGFFLFSHHIEQHFLWKEHKKGF